MAKKPKISKEERFRRKHYRAARSVFRNAGFERVSQASDKNFTFNGQEGDLDDVFVFENVVLLLEYTCHGLSKVGDHLKKKKILFTKIVSDPEGFLEFFKTRFPDLGSAMNPAYHDSQIILKIVYCSYQEPSQVTKANVQEPVYLDYPNLKYFEKIAGTIKLSARHELLEFLGVDTAKVGREGKFPKAGVAERYHGSILPEASSGFKKGYKVVSFYADPASLMARAFVLRRDGWRGSLESYQRMLQKSKVDEIRKKLKSNKQVFVNNLITTLPADVHPVNPDGSTVDISTLKETSPVELSLPAKANSIGIIDGQHRLFSYHETTQDDATIALLRHQQNLLVTGIIYPNGASRAERDRFEAELFLNINSNQTNAPKALRQEIDLILKPFESESIAKKVMHLLAIDGPLSGHVERHFYDQGLLKTTSIVSYGLAPLVKLGGNDSIFALLSAEQQKALVEDQSDDALEAYVDLSKTTIDTVLSAVREKISYARWTTDRKVANRALTVTYINSFLILTRLLIEKKRSLKLASLKSRLDGIDKFNFSAFHSSQYNRMAQKMYTDFF